MSDTAVSVSDTEGFRGIFQKGKNLVQFFEVMSNQEKPIVADTLIISDTHLGSEVCRARELLKILTSCRFNRLVLNGDIFDDLNFERLNRLHWDVVSYIRHLSNPERGIEVVWVRGNHDHALINVMPNLLGIDAFSEYEWEYNGEKYFALHGDQFDNFLYGHKFISFIATIFYDLVQKIDSRDMRFSRFIKRRSKKWLRLSKNVANGAMHYAKLRKAQYVFCGHTHQAMKKEMDGVKYYNSGCWTDIPSHFITVGEDGVKIHVCDRVETEKITFAKI